MDGAAHSTPRRAQDGACAAGAQDGAAHSTPRRAQDGACAAGAQDGAAHSTPRQPTTTAWLYRARSMSSPSEIYELTERDL